MQMLTGNQVDFAKLITAPNLLTNFNYFGGSCSEGQVLIPSPDQIRWAHRNGVNILGTIFFPDNCGEESSHWYDTFTSSKIEPASGKPYYLRYAEILTEMAALYHFDGFFINQESVPTAEAVRSYR